ncbi:hypothetical protein Rsub_13240, partial [Raphidocelis subcapitata]
MRAAERLLRTTTAGGRPAPSLLLSLRAAAALAAAARLPSHRAAPAVAAAAGRSSGGSAGRGGGSGGRGGRDGGGGGGGAAGGRDSAARTGGGGGGGGRDSGSGSGKRGARQQRGGRQDRTLQWKSSASAAAGGDEERDTGGPLESMSDAMFQSLINNEEAIAKLRGAVLGQMAAANISGPADGAAAATAAAGAPPARAPPRARVFDSDDYSDAGSEAEDDVSAADRMARAAAARLDAESVEYIQHHLPGRGGGGGGGGAAGESRDWAEGAGGGRGGGRRGRAAAGAAGGAGSAAAAAAGSGRGGRPGGGGGGGRGGAALQQPAVSGRAPGRLAGGTAIGRAVEARAGGFAVAVLREGKTRLFEAGSPMVYGGAIEKVLGQPPPGPADPIVVVTPGMVPLGWGVYNPSSMFRVRLMQSELECLQDDSCVMEMERLIDLRIRQAAELRAALGLLPIAPEADAAEAAAADAGAGRGGGGGRRGATTVFRLVNSEGDCLSGVVADQLGDVVVVQSCAAWSERHRETIVGAIKRHSGASRVVWRPATSILLEEGIDAPAPPDAAPEAAPFAASEAAGGSLDEPEADGIASDYDQSGAAESEEERDPVEVAAEGAVRVREGGVVFLASPERGQKTGFYADQRDNRAFIASLSAGKTVLDLCCYSGGFALTAAAAGATAAIGVDSSGPAVALATANARANGLEGRVGFYKDDVSAFMRAAVERGDAWDVVVLDPPKLAPNRSALRAASGKYRRLNAMAMALVKPGGVLMTCSCSGAMTQSGGLPAIVEEAARQAERQITLLRKSGAAPDHPLNPAYPEG